MMMSRQLQARTLTTAWTILVLGACTTSDAGPPAGVDGEAAEPGENLDRNTEGPAEASAEAGAGAGRPDAGQRGEPAELDAATHPDHDRASLDSGAADASSAQRSTDHRLDHAARTVAIDGARLVTGGAGDQAVHVYTLEGCAWALEDTLEGDEPSFGHALAIRGDTLLVGAYGDGGSDPVADGGLPVDGPGAAYVFERVGTAWTLQQQLVPNDPQPGVGFGFSVALGGDVAVVGSLYGPATYAFERRDGQWNQMQRFSGGDTTTWGETVAIDGDTLIISAAEHGFSGSTALHAFARSGQTWVEQQVLTPTSTATHNWGARASLDQGLLAIGIVPAFAAAKMWPGTFVHVYTRVGDSWGGEQQLAPGSGVPSLHAGALLVGVPLEVGAFVRQGATRLFDCATEPCAERATLGSESPSLNAGFGGSVALGDQCAAVASTGSLAGPPELFELGAIP